MITLLIFVLALMLALGIIWLVSGLFGLPQNVRILILLLVLLLVILYYLQAGPPIRI